MFNKKIIQSIENNRQYLQELEQVVNRNHKWRCEDYAQFRLELDAMKNDIVLLVNALGLSRHETHTVEYIKKGGPEQP